MAPEDEQVQLQVRKLQDYITDHFYTCSDKILCGLGRMYAGGGELTENIDDVGMVAIYMNPVSVILIWQMR